LFYQQSIADVIGWDSLDPQQQQLLKAFENEWDQLPEQRKVHRQKIKNHRIEITPQP